MFLFREEKLYTEGEKAEKKQREGESRRHISEWRELVLLLLFWVWESLKDSGESLQENPRPKHDTKCPMFTKANTDFQENNGKIGESWVSGGKKDVLSMSWPRRRLLGGPGSSPPRCTSKCGKCTPCKPVHVPVPPGTPVTAEYYPEAWRCKCGNKLYMP
ncbi:hypothetical protein VIGAN_03108400 [Vigna angularis var. angularis]|uniref:Epidermal patterning factor-like protein n=1 Tax=Vigna angularis var. angularis TaxID=157739 RepID=A0A0S3RLJ1_PHAAN|nr:EPIDERMAL PATTERNING FACTOR-like protein 6 isoform X1 [Vigna angularis]BAT81375.1 hypothetical protein VIGAN_03108400 [Vigna angularis var. angularis]